MKLIILAIVILSATVSACPSEHEFRIELKKGLFEYLQNPEYSRLTVHEVKDMLDFYLTRNMSGLDCDMEIGTESGLSIGDILNKAETIGDMVIPRCSDLTMYGDCSGKKPKFCYSGMLISMCHGPDNIEGNADDCGCPEYEVCNTDGSCARVGIACYADDNCGLSGYTGNSYCLNRALMQEYVEFTCHNPGLGESYCSYESESRLVENCTVDCINNTCI
jgi:hypothetical protein